ncbi:putative leader peptide [Streptomyces sp. NPDC048595]
MTPVPPSVPLAVADVAPRGCVRLYGRPHIDLQRVAGALCPA